MVELFQCAFHGGKGRQLFRAASPLAFRGHENATSWFDGAVIDADAIYQATEEAARLRIASRTYDRLPQFTGGRDMVDSSCDAGLRSSVP